MNLSKEKFLIKRHSERSHAVAKSKNLGSCVIASLVRGVAISCLLFLAACSDDPKVGGGTEEDSGIIAISDKTISGVSQKGPFVNGSSVTVYGLDGETLAQTGNIYEGKIKSDMGDFSVKVVKLASQYALLKANGFYRNEVTGEKSNSQMTLYALTDLSDRDEVNVNLLTHLAYERSLYLATNSMSVANAKKQAEAEVFKSFEIEGDFGVAEDLNIFGENDQSAALLAISVLMQGDLKEADFSERLDNYARDIEEDGKWDDKKTATAIADWASEKSLGGGLATIRANVEKWGQLFGVPPFEKYVNNFWWQNYGLGTCGKERQGEVKVNDNALSVKNGVHFICDSNAWRLATDIEKDTYKWIDPTIKNTAKDGDVRYGNVVKTNCYVFEDKTWRSGDAIDCSLGLRGCTALRQDTVGQGSDKGYHICDAKTWRDATTYEKDTYKQECSEFGQIVHGNVNTNYAYFCYGEEWKRFYGNESVTYGKLVDERDGQIYRTIKINNQVWMAENLKYCSNGSSCYMDDDECEKMGRLYTHSAARKSCPKGWHLPSSIEFQTLFSNVGMYRIYEWSEDVQNWGGLEFLKSKLEWIDGSGTDDFGFTVLPSGVCIDGDYNNSLDGDEISTGGCYDKYRIAAFWVYDDSDFRGLIALHHSNNRVWAKIGDCGDGSCYTSKTSRLSVRCVKDEE